MPYENLLLDIDEGVAVITINRPKSLNSLNRATLAELSQVLDLVGNDREVKAVILTGAGDKAFVAGGDIPYMQEMDSMKAREFVQFGHKVLRKLEYLPKPVIAAVNGFCLGGGCELALACDFRIASHRAKFGQPEVKLGVIPGLGGTQRLPRVVGTGMAKQLLFTGDIIDAQEALRIGLINEIVLSGELMSSALGIVRRIVSGGLLAISLCKFAVNEGLQTDLDRAVTIESDLFGLCFGTYDQKEGMKAFADKRAPQFRGE